MKEPKIEYNDSGFYRIVFPDSSHSKWNGFDCVATAMWNGKKYVAFSHYWEGGDRFNMVGVHEIAESFG